MEELERVLGSEKFGLSKEEIRSLVTPIFNIAEIIVPRCNINIITRSPGDNRVLECAIDGDCQCIVTGDRRDLLVCHTTLYKASWKPIVADNVFNAVKERLNANKSRYKSESLKRHPYLLTSLVFCDECGRRMIGKSARGTKSKYFYYDHRSRGNLHENSCSDCATIRIRSELLENTVLNRLNELTKSPSLINEFLKKAKLDGKDFRLKEKIAKKEMELLDIERKLENLAVHLSVLPKGSNANALYKQMNKLEKLKQILIEKINNLKAETLTFVKKVLKQRFSAS
jgi:hypothetical protein